MHVIVIINYVIINKKKANSDPSILQQLRKTNAIFIKSKDPLGFFPLHAIPRPTDEDNGNKAN